ncbi:hypothetical protein [Marichromatium sp. AB31]|uniref:phage tail terminator protein n=1 Tax=Marichromatium sp. AB31 TaxID=2483362 RepID=UPI000F3C2C86|nr:hypothetical protein [Marichromatium sp. AB31]RNE89874.1 hypothetical protein EBL84_09305 [Marichromatium sp. AB31]
MPSLLALGPEIVERLAAHLPATVQVLEGRSAEDFARPTQIAPAIYVIYDGGAIAQSRPDARAARITQRWLCVCVARNLRELASGAAALNDAGALADGVLEALMGWQPEGTSQPLTLTDLPTPRYDTGYQMVPLAFTTELVRKTTAA